MRDVRKMVTFIMLLEPKCTFSGPEQTFRLILRVDLVKRKKQTRVQTEMIKHSSPSLQTAPKTD